MTEDEAIKCLRKLNEDVLMCLYRSASESPHGTIIRVDDETWIVKDIGLTI